jgi:hypothetical protein
MAISYLGSGRIFKLGDAGNNKASSRQCSAKEKDIFHNSSHPRRADESCTVNTDPNGLALFGSVILISIAEKI